MDVAILNAFGHDPQLAGQVLQAYRDGVAPDLLARICAYITSLLPSQPTLPPTASQPSKKRKLEPSENGQSNGTADHSFDLYGEPKIWFDCKDVSFSAPARKKLRLQFVTSALNLSQKQIRLLHPQTGAVEYALRGEEVAEFFCLPVPDKAQRQRNFVVFPQHGALAQDGSPAEPIVWTMNEVKGKPETVSVATDLHGGEEDTFVSTTLRELDHFMTGLRGQTTTLPDEREFASAIPQSHRKGEKAFHVKAFKGSKEGYLFLLPNGILFGFKKPLQFFPFASIDSISYTSVLQRTFNLNITALDQEHEFSMLDQADFAGIDEYVKRHGLNDASLATERRAKAYNVNKPRGGDGGDANGGGGAGEEAEE